MPRDGGALKPQHAGRLPALRKHKPRQVQCPLCGMMVSLMFGLEGHQRGRTCKAVQRVKQLNDEGLRVLRSKVAAALLLDPALGPMIRQDVTDVDFSNKPSPVVHGYWAPAWFVAVVHAQPDDRFDTGGEQWWMEERDDYTTVVRTPHETALRVLRAMVEEDDDGRDVFLSAMRLNGLAGALQLMGERGIDAEVDEAALAALFGSDDDDD